MPKYIAKQSIGQFLPGEEIKGLDADRIQALLSSGAIEEYQAPEEQKEDGTAARLAELEKANTDLTKANAALTEANQTAATEKAKADQEVANLKAKVAEFEKTKPAAKPKADSKPVDEIK